MKTKYILSNISMDNDIRCHVRLRYVDAPDIRNTTDHAIKTQAKQSKRALEQLILNRDIDLFCISRDRYGRLLAIAYFKNINVNWWLINNGFAQHISCRQIDRDNICVALCEPEPEHELEPEYEHITHSISLHPVAINTQYLYLLDSDLDPLSPVSVRRS